MPSLEPFCLVSSTNAKRVPNVRPLNLAHPCDVPTTIAGGGDTARRVVTCVFPSSAASGRPVLAPSAPPTRAGRMPQDRLEAEYPLPGRLKTRTVRGGAAGCGTRAGSRQRRPGAPTRRWGVRRRTRTSLPVSAESVAVPDDERWRYRPTGPQYPRRARSDNWMKDGSVRRTVGSVLRHGRRLTSQSAPPVPPRLRSAGRLPRLRQAHQAGVRGDHGRHAYRASTTATPASRLEPTQGEDRPCPVGQPEPPHAIAADARYVGPPPCALSSTVAHEAQQPRMSPKLDNLGQQSRRCQGRSGLICGSQETGSDMGKRGETAGHSLARTDGLSPLKTAMAATSSWVRIPRPPLAGAIGGDGAPCR